MSWILLAMFAVGPTEILHLPNGADRDSCQRQAVLQKKLHPTATFQCFSYYRVIT